MTNEKIKQLLAIDPDCVLTCDLQNAITELQTELKVKSDAYHEKMNKGIQEYITLQNKVTALERPLKANGFKAEGMLAVGQELINRDLKISNLQAELDKAKFVTGKFREWLASEGCPYDEFKWCADRGNVKTDYDAEMKNRDTEDVFPFDPETDCSNEMQGWCYARYYEKLFDEQQAEKITTPNVEKT